MSKLLEGILIINIIGCGVFVVGTALGLLWFRAMGDTLERNTVWFIVKIFLAIWAFGNVMFFIVR